MPHNFSWIADDRLAGMGRPGCGLELAGEMLPYERRFLSWLHFAATLSADRQKLAERIRLPVSDALQAERRMLDLYRKFRDIWGILDSYREGFGEENRAVDRFVLGTGRLETDLGFLKDQGIDTIVSLTEEGPLDREVAEPFGFTIVHLPIPDRRAPTAEQIDWFVQFVDGELGGGRRVLVHCLGVYGRTGTMLACYLVHCGSPAERALAEVRNLRPGSVETGEQETAVFEYEERSQ